MGLKVVSTQLNVLNMRTRMPFKYGIATLTALPHVMLKMEVDIEGQRHVGIAAEGLPPKWFTKSPDTHFRDDLVDMIAVIEHACEIAKAVVESDTVFDLWQQVYTMQAHWGNNQNYPPLLSGLGASLVERASIDAFCNAANMPFGNALRSGALGFRLGDLHAELGGVDPASLLPAKSLASVAARHTVGLVDPLTDGEISDDERIDDGLPQSLEACIKCYGLTHFKIKLCGDVDRDIARLEQLARLIPAHCNDDFAFTLDGNEQYRAVAPFREVWQTLSGEPAIRDFLERIIFVEQPFHRDVALGDDLGKDLMGWKDRPAIVIDESDGEIASARIALSRGYVGTSFKNCKGVFKGAANACLIAKRNRDGHGKYMMSGEDLANVGPLALLQDLAVAASLGLTHVERNGHHYFKGLSMWPAQVQSAAINAHDDVYHILSADSEQSFPAVNIQRGQIHLQSVNDAPFGFSGEVDTNQFTPLADWDYDSLEA